jgi:cold shock CspA family protein
MKWSLQITFRNVKSSAILEEWVREEAEKLDGFYSHIIACRVAVEVPHRHHHRGGAYHIRIDLRVPGGEIVVNREPSLATEVRHLEQFAATKHLELNALHKNLHLAIKSAFRIAARRLQDYARRQRGDVKRHAAAAPAFVSKIFPEQGYGFLTSNDGREIYFHAHSVLNEAFRGLALGTEVSFVEEQGEYGPQASTVRVLESPTLSHDRKRAEALVH